MTASGIDLNGLCDLAFVLGSVSDDVRTPIPAAVIDRRPLITGVPAAEAPAGDHPWENGRRYGILELLAMLRKGVKQQTKHDPANLIGGHLRALTPSGTRAPVVAIPETPSFDEHVRSRLIDGAAHEGLDVTLLWRPVAALLGWAEGLSPNEIAPLNGATILVIQFLPEGIAVSSLNIEVQPRSRGGLLTPVRRRDATRDTMAFDGHDLLARANDATAHHVAGEADARSLLWGSSGWFWDTLRGQQAAEHLVRIGQRWIRLHAPTDSAAQFAQSVSRTITELLRRHEGPIRTATKILIEGTLAAHPIGHADRASAAQHTIAALDPAHQGKAVILPVNTTAHGCAVAAHRRTLGQAVYYDFLPQLEINAMIADVPSFVELIPKNKRLPGGTAYRGYAPARFEILKGAKRLPFYLFKEDFPQGRKVDVDLPEEATARHPIRVSVEQVRARALRACASNLTALNRFAASLLS